MEQYATRIAEKLKHLPDRPGVYMMRDQAGQVIYVGKAISLRSRVRSYFQESSDPSPKTRAMVSHVADLEYIVTDSEVEALILECNLIKEKEPWYNIRLKDDKSYPFIKIADESFPRVMVVRRPDKRDRVYGPYTDVRAVRETLQFLRRLFPLRTCNLDLSTRRDYRPCLLYHIDRCGAPCAGLQSEEEYGELVSQVQLFLEGRHERLLPDLERKMTEAASRLDFEQAARIRDQVRSLQKVVERQKIVTSASVDQDVVGVAVRSGEACVQLFFVRGGKVVGGEHFFLHVGEDEDRVQVLTAFVEQHYSGASFVPRELLLPERLDDADVVAAWLSSRRGGPVRLHVPQRGEKRRLVEMVSENARLVLAERQERASLRVRRNEAGLQQLQELLALATLPRRIEAFDISNLQGAESVAAMVVLQDGEPLPTEYRRFRIKSVTGADDFASMREVIRRRFAGGLREREEIAALPNEEQAAALERARFARFPDTVLVDGGRGQLNASLEVLSELGLEGIPVAGLAERLEELYTPDEGEPVRLPSDSPGLHLVQRIRDEAHRFAIAYHRQLRGRRTTQSALDHIEGVGPKRKRALIKHFGSLQGVRAASLEELKRVPGVPQEVARRIHEQLGSGRHAGGSMSKEGIEAST